ncbi:MULTISPECIES: bifunctional 2-methylcitrate synthase/citrate synthase [Glutamicibacter]|jgi:2-methylcitrate synthase|uniref:Citrate synthase n=3 Tax=Glutamicibacter arilaitensis TaxID=256701 RepID=A0A2N7S5J9_9MICC|nr:MULTISPECIES: bifunctional 2-methylcitrate synthase/citrate synthase [Glutamicibacter]PMQ21418.1 2-methylcitrate synthase [Glutamicibacter arilaitensis]TFH57657.1 bifunctional 2-methylcitrate synthase/citrate synthase [Glutamicibacter arilaitensis]CBT75381.1 2-methylcitrate synthase [Glutamicibacter arilaitensis Re117]HCH47267.1 bifunctional 2-methylcitrate synthase/citrate synthase [Glutamicibacter sp.]HCJ55483.1 bifunctional 2-methylcitrate synthase/citrate synthase [Glutamicibacter sp.]
MTATEEIKKGLAGVVVDYTAVSKVNPETNSLLYRGYPVQDLAANKSFEEVALLLWNGELPTPSELTEFSAFERANRALDPRVKAAIDLLPTDCHPMDVGRTAVSVIGANHPQAENSSPEAELLKAKELFAAFPAVVAYDQRRRRGQEPVAPREDLDYSANFLWMTFGEEAAPEVVDAFRVSMVLYAEHSFNASTFTARVITSTLSDLHSAVTGAIGALKGPLHGGANEAVMHTFNEIGIDKEESREDAAKRAKSWMEDALAAKKKVMGFGHRVYKHGDSRVPTMKAALDRMIEHYGRHEMLGLYDGLEAAMDEAKAIKPNLDYPAGPTYHLMGFDTEMFTPIFIAARITGWTSHIFEQRAANALIRPLSAYNGVEQRSL